MKIVLPNGIAIHSESPSDVDALMAWLGAAPASVLGLPSLPVSSPPPAVEEGEATPAVCPAGASGPVEAPTESSVPSEPAAKAKRFPSMPPTAPERVGSFVRIEATAERYHGQVVWLYRCGGCSTEARLAGQPARRRKQVLPCKCGSVRVEAGAPGSLAAGAR